MTPEMFEFFRPVSWDNHDDAYKYSKGGTANVILYREQFFVITARHVLTKDDRELSDVFIPHRSNSQYRLAIGKGANFTPKEPEEPDTAHHDVQIHSIPVFYEKEEPLTPNEYLVAIDNLPERDEYRKLYLSGYADEDYEIDYEKGESRGFGDTIVGEYGGDDPSSRGLGFFRSNSLRGLDVNGMSGGAVTSIFDERPILEGILIQGAGNKESKYVRFVTAEVVYEMLAMTHSKLKNAELQK